jgi:mannose/fructose/N-acetylgalactosamine-specific phosphotransferase system component IIC
VSALELLPFAILGAILGLDVVSFPQAMISRPIVAATLAGALIGHATSGLLIGAALELFALETLPVGASRYPEWGSASVVGGALFASRPDSAGSMTIALLGALATAWVGGWTMVLLRRLNAAWARRHRASLEAGSQQTVIGLQLAGLTADLVRGGALTFLGLLLLRPLAARSIALWTVDARLSRALVVGIASAVAAGAVWKIFHWARGGVWLFLGGLFVALLALR